MGNLTDIGRANSPTAKKYFKDKQTLEERQACHLAFAECDKETFKCQKDWMHCMRHDLRLYKRTQPVEDEYRVEAC